jgi:hypothetical protein
MDCFSSALHSACLRPESSSCVFSTTSLNGRVEIWASGWEWQGWDMSFRLRNP